MTKINDDNYFDHDADIGIIGRGFSLEASFANAAEAMFALMGDLSSVQPKNTVKIIFEESDIELALVTWLNLLLAKAQAENLLLSTFQLIKEGDTWRGQAKGTLWHEGIERGIDVKGATLTMLSVKHLDVLWESKCVVDV